MSATSIYVQYLDHDPVSFITDVGTNGPSHLVEEFTYSFGPNWRVWSVVPIPLKDRIGCNLMPPKKTHSFTPKAEEENLDEANVALLES